MRTSHHWSRGKFAGAVTPRPPGDELSTVLGSVKDAARRSRGGLRPSLTAAGPGIRAMSGRDEETALSTPVRSIAEQIQLVIVQRRSGTVGRL